MNDQPSPAEMLTVAENQKKHTERRLGGRPGVLCGAWGAAWLLGFGTLYLTIGPHPVLSVPLWTALSLFFAFLIAAGVVTAVHMVRAGRGVRGPNRTAWAMYGWSWTLGFLGLGAMVTALSELGIPDSAYGLLWSAGSGLLVGVLFLTGGALGNDWVQYMIGLWLLVINGAGAFAGIPGHYLVMSLAGGGGLVIVAAVLSVPRATTRCRRVATRCRQALA